MAEEPRLIVRSQPDKTDGRRFLRTLRSALHGPLRTLLLLFALGMAGRILLLREPDIGLMNLLSILVVLVVVWAVLRLIDNLVMIYSQNLRQRHPNLRGELVNFISNMARIVVIIVTALYLLEDVGYDITTLLASLGIGGLAIAFAAEETIANMFGCISIIADDLFRQGDWIVTPEAEGTVIDVGLRSTKIRTFDNAMDSHGVKRTLLVYLDALGESSINILVYCFSKTVDWEEWLRVQQDVIFRCCDIVAANGLSIAFPSRTLYLREDGRDADQADHTRRG